MGKVKIGKGQSKQICMPQSVINIPLVDYTYQINELHQKIDSIRCNHVCQCGSRTIEQNKVYNITHQVISTKDTKVRKHSRLLKKLTDSQYDVILNEIDKLIISNHQLKIKLETLESKKSEETPILTVEKHTETIKEIEYKTDKRMLMIIALSSLINFIVIMVLK